jgi:hypothetical protein
VRDQLSLTSAAVALALVAGATACGSEGLPDARNPGHVKVTWDVRKAGNAASCGEVGGVQVKVTILDEGTGFSQTDQFACALFTSNTRDLNPGSYTLTIELDGAAGPIAPVTTLNHVAVKAGMDTALDTIVFTVS